jgi:hypothetical protein
MRVETFGMFGDWRCVDCKEWGQIFDETGKWTEHHCNNQKEK